jgi:hypothetical protein
MIPEQFFAVCYLGLVVALIAILTPLFFIF